MRKQKQFTEEQKLQLLASPFIERVLSNHLEYTLEFKQMAVTQYLQGKPHKNTIFEQSFYDQWHEPIFVKSSFVPDNPVKYGISELNFHTSYPFCYTNKPDYKTHTFYRITDDIYEYLVNVYNNPEKAKWQSRIQEAIKEYPNEEFQVVSVNNTLIYITDKDVRMDTIKNIYRILKPGGIFIWENREEYRPEYSQVFTPENSVEIYRGIYKKLC